MIPPVQALLCLPLAALTSYGLGFVSWIRDPWTGYHTATTPAAYVAVLQKVLEAIFPIFPYAHIKNFQGVGILWSYTHSVIREMTF